MSDNCLFCDIIKKKIPSEIVGETEYVIAFRDINPVAPTHILIIPKKHITSTSDLNEGNIHYLSEMAFLANEVSNNENIYKSGYRWVINTRSDGGQTVDHLHLHVLGGRNMTWPPG